ncbi:MAG: oligoribonuclease [Gammaproteobacteria bacterium]
MQYSDQNLVWIDLEMTGLEPERDVIIEIATIVTDAHLTEQVEGPLVAIHHGDDVLAAMDDWNTRQHGESGLTARVRASTQSTADAEAATLDFLRRWVPPRTSPMCGNSICQDRRFLYRYMPELAEFFHYRNLDVSTLKELAARWAPGLPAFTKQGRHLALDDIRDSIGELAHYRAHFLRLPA